jgi:hypothetical protein
MGRFAGNDFFVRVHVVERVFELMGFGSNVSITPPLTGLTGKSPPPPQWGLWYPFDAFLIPPIPFFGLP